MVFAPRTRIGSFGFCFLWTTVHSELLEAAAAARLAHEPTADWAVASTDGWVVVAPALAPDISVSYCWAGTPPGAVELLPSCFRVSISWCCATVSSSLLIFCSNMQTSSSSGFSAGTRSRLAATKRGSTPMSWQNTLSWNRLYIGLMEQSLAEDMCVVQWLSVCHPIKLQH